MLAYFTSKESFQRTQQYTVSLSMHASVWAKPSFHDGSLLISLSP